MRWQGADERDRAAEVSWERMVIGLSGLADEMQLLKSGLPGFCKPTAMNRYTFLVSLLRVHLVLLMHLCEPTRICM